jgi:hydroxymethylglutaryl-CoA lyase
MGLLMVELVEVAPRDGLQNQPELLDTAVKRDLIARAVAAGLRRIEVTGFARPDRVPQLADADALAAGLTPVPGVTYTALVLNERGYDRARAAGIGEVNLVVLATDEFSRRNQGMPTDAVLAATGAIAERARADGVRFTATVGAAFGCPFTGEVPVSRLVEVLRTLVSLRPAEVALADTIGVAVPTDITERFTLARAVLGAEVPLRAHLHDTRNTGVANAVAAVRAGVPALDTSLAGVGGCPFAPAASGNVATEDLAWVLSRMGLRLDLDLAALVDSARWLADRLGIAPPGSLARAGLFPPA